MKVMSTPRSLELSITGKCNLHCLYCSHFDSPSDTFDIPAADWKKFFAELNRCSVMDVTLQGGEPFCRPDLEELIWEIVRNRMRYSILTNGTLISDENAQFLAATGRCDFVQVSIDGSGPEFHESCRDKGSFAKALEGIGRLQSRNVNTTVRVTVHQGNVPDLERIARLLLEEIGLPGFSVNAASHFGLCRAFSDRVQLPPEKRSSAMESLARLAELYPDRIQATAGPLADARMWAEMERSRITGEDPLPGDGFLSGCGGVFSRMAVRPDGVMVPCSQLSHIALGRINTDSLAEVWLNHPELNRLRRRRETKLDSFEYCRDCAHVRFCTGGCPAVSFSFTGDEYRPDCVTCFRKFLEDGGVLKKDI
ncbi:MAG TPA: SynChlorMet cassette radical SAM/SPASM protein ScmE [Syntrophales bacterium]|nr:SynChlorMet cassette radical SAM/SPASM protein ScmE [Syntrophales bacterium]